LVLIVRLRICRKQYAAFILPVPSSANPVY
jgi:hypothetical protein